MKEKTKRRRKKKPRRFEVSKITREKNKKGPSEAFSNFIYHRWFWWPDCTDRGKPIEARSNVLGARGSCAMNYSFPNDGQSGRWPFDNIEF